MSAIQWLKREARGALIRTRWGFFGFDLPRHPSGISGSKSTVRVMHTAGAWLIAKYACLFVPVVLVVSAAYQLGLVPDWLGPACVLVFLAANGGSRILYRFASGRYEATLTHDLMKALFSIKGPNGQYLRPLPSSPYVMGGVTMEVPQADGWVTATAREHRGSHVLVFAWWPGDKASRSEWARSKGAIIAGLVIGDARRPTNTFEQSLARMAEGLNRTLADTTAQYVQIEDLDLVADQRNGGFTIDAEYECKTTDLSGDARQDVFWKARAFTFEDKITQVTVSSRLPAESETDTGDRRSELLAFLESVKPIERVESAAGVDSYERV